MPSSSPTHEDPRAILAAGKMGGRQILAVAICTLLNALDGFDVLSISFASPGIAAEWGIGRGALGIVLSMELIGMAVGSVVLGNIADRVGRRKTILGALVVMGVGMYLATTATGLATLSAYRLFTGLGIGGMLAATNAVVAEFSNARLKSMSVAIMAAGYPVGAIVGGSIASYLLAATGDWRSVFYFGIVASAIMLPVVWFLLPESVGYLVQARPHGALERINDIMRKLGHRTVPDLPPATADEPKTSVKQLFSGRLARITILLTLAYFAHIMTFYFILKWVPKVVVDMGYPPALAGGVLVWANVGGLLGSIVLSLLSVRIPTRTLVLGAMLLSTATVIVFGTGASGLAMLSLMSALAGFFTNAGVVGLYALIAHGFPSAVRAGGTGFVIGVGRGGAALGPVIAGFLFEAGLGLLGVAIAMGLGSLIGAVCIFGLKQSDEAAL
ncbi:MFS transporter [Piscicoccus intestinalis]|uniref:MFS transporter n=1 Tax=Piscicoccus intestinalis TaxID=746033 RepID=UPI000ABCE4D8|nr:MFS transporter [Piscicoccus intestinalis]